MTSSTASPSFMFTSECPIICLDGTLLACSSIAQTCIPRAAIHKEVLINLIKGAVENAEKGKKTEISALRRLLQRRASTGHKLTSAEKRLIFKEERHTKCHSWGPGGDNGVLMGLDRICKDPAIVSHEGKTKNTGNSQRTATAENLRNKRTEFEKSIAWIRDEQEEYITTEKFYDIAELEILLDVLMQCKTPSLLEAEVNSLGEIIVTYQLLYGFRNEYMMVKINSKYSLLMRTF